MPILDGYTFVMDLQDRGVMRGLKGMKDAMNVLKTEMRAGFSEIKTSEGTLAAYNFKLKETQNIIKQYENNIGALSKRYGDYQTKLDALQNTEREAKQHMEEMKQTYSATSDEVKKAANEYQRAQRATNRFVKETETAKKELDKEKSALASMKQQQKDTVAQIEKMKTGFYDFRRETEAVSKTTKVYVEELKKSGSYFKANSLELRGLATEQKSVSGLYKAQKSILAEVSSRQKKLTSEYQEEITKLKSLKTAVEQRNAALKNARNIYGEESTIVKKDAQALREAQSAYEKQRALLTGMPEKISQVNKEYSEQAVEVAKAKTRLSELNRVVGTTAWSQAKAKVSSFTNAVSQTGQRFKESTSNTREWANSVKSGAMTAAVGIGTLTAGVGKATQMATSLQNTWITASNLLVTSGEKTASVTKNVAQMQRDATKYSKEYGVSQQDIANQYVELIKRGYSAESALGAMKAELQGARASGDDFSDVVEGASQAIDAFGFRTNNAAKMTANTNRVINAMAYSADLTSTNFQHMSEGMAYVSSTAARAGQSIEMTSAALGVLSNAGLEGSQAGTGLRKVLNSLISPTKGAKAALKQLGLTVKDFQDSSGKLKPINKIFETLESHMKGMTRTRQMDIFHSIFGTTGQQAASMLAAQANEITRVADGAERAGKGTTYIQRLADKNMQSVQNQLARVKANIEAIALEIGNGILPAISKATKGFADWMNTSEGKKNIKELENNIVSLATGIANHTKDVIGFFSGFIDGANNAIKAITTIGNGINGVLKRFGIGGGKGANPIVKFMGEATGAVLAFMVPLKLMKTIFGGVFAVGKDVGKLVDWARGNKEVSTRNTMMKEMIDLQKESIRLTQEQLRLDREDTRAVGNRKSKEGSASTGNAIADTADAVDTVADIAGGKEGKAEAKIAKDAEKVGTKSAVSYQKGFRGRFRGWGGKLLALLSFEDLIPKMGNIGDKIGNITVKGILNPFKKLPGRIWGSLKGIGRGIKGLFTSPINQMAKIGDKIGTKFNGGLISRLKKFKFSWKGLFRGASKEAGEAGKGVSRGFLSRFKLKGFSFKGLFRGAGKAGEEAGTKSGTGLLSGLKGKTGGIKGLLKSGFGKGLGAVNILLTGFDIINALKQKNGNERWKQLGSTGGSLAGAAAGGSLGATLGSVVPGIGTVVGGVLGSIVGGIAGSKIGEVLGVKLRKSVQDFGKIGKQQVKATKKIYDDIFKKHDWKKTWSDMTKTWKDTWNGLTKWWDDMVGKKTNKTPKKPKKKKKSTPTKKTIKSLGGNHYSKKDIANVKEMNKAITAYTKSLKGLKSAIKSNDPTKELNKMNESLKKSTKGWDKLAKPIKKMGDAFKTLATFTQSMAKKDAFSALTKDLPNLAKSLKTNAPKIKDGLKKIESALKGGTKGSKKGSKGIKEYADEIAKGLKNLSGKLSGIQKPIGKVAGSFDKLQKAMKGLAGGAKGKTEFDKVSDGLKSMHKALSSVLSGKNSLDDLTKKLSDALKKSKLASNLKDLQKPLGNLTKNLKDMKKPIDSIASSFKKLDTVFTDFNKAKVNPLKSFSDGIKDLSQKLSGASGKHGFISQLKNFSDVLNSIGGKGKKKGTSNLAQVAKDAKALASPIKDLSKSLQTFNGKNDPLKKFSDGLSKLKSSLGGKNNLASKLKELTSAFGASSTGKGEGDSKSKKSTNSFASALNSIDKPLSKIANSFKKLQKPIQTFSKAIKPFNSKKNNPLREMADGFKELDKRLKSGKNGINQKIEDLAQSFNGGKGKSKTKSLASLIKDVVKPLNTMTKDFKGLQKPISKVANGLKHFKNVLDSFGGKKTNGLSGVTNAVKTLYNALKRYPFGNLIKAQADKAKKALSGNNFAKLFVNATRSLTKELNSFSRAFDKDWSNLWKNINKPVKTGLDSVLKQAVSSTKSLDSKFKSYENSQLKAWKSWINNVKNAFRSGMNALPGYASSAMRSVISKMNAGIGGINKVIGEFGGSKKLATIGYAEGTKSKGGHPGGHMLVNDSKKPHWKELVKFPGQDWRMFDQKNTFIPNAPKGTQVINGDDTYKIMSKRGVYAYADGTDMMDPDKAIKLMDEIDKNPLSFLKKTFFGATKFNGSAVVQDFGTAASNAFLRAIKDPFKKTIDEFGGALANPGGAGVARWAPYIKRAAAFMHVNLTAAGLSKILSNIAHESNGSPTVVNGWDINARLGHPSVGLVQFIQPTFDHYAMPGHRNIRSGYDQLIALFNDATWFSDIAPGGGWGPTGARRFALGGFSTQHQMAEISEGNSPEAIIPLDLNKRPRAYQLLGETLAQMKGDADGQFNNAQQLQDAKDRKVTNEKIDQLISLMTELVTGDQLQETSINVDGRKLASSLTRYTRRENAKAQFKGNLGFSNS